MTTRKPAAKPKAARAVGSGAGRRRLGDRLTARRTGVAPAKPKPRKPKAKPPAKPAAKRQAPASRPRGKAGPPGKPAVKDTTGPAVKAVERDLKRMPTEVAKSAEAAAALAMAARLDTGEGSPSECAKALLQAMGKLREMCPPEERKGQLHAIRSGRADRLAAGSPAG